MSLILLPPKQQNRFRIEVSLTRSQHPIEVLTREAVAVEPIKYKPGVNTAVNVIFQDDIESGAVAALLALWEKALVLNLYTLDGNDDVLSTWKFPLCHLTSLTHGPFDYAFSEGIMVMGHFVGQNGSLTVKS